MSFILNPVDEPPIEVSTSAGSLDALSNANNTELNLPFADAKYHVIKKTSQAETTFLASLFGSSSSKSYASIVHEVRRYNRISEKDKVTLVGVAVRMIAITSNLNLDFELTIPNLAAAGQLDNTDAFAAISVVGYNAALGDLLVVPKNLDVESFMEFTQSFTRLQRAIFSSEGERYYIPTRIEYID